MLRRIRRFRPRSASSSKDSVDDLQAGYASVFPQDNAEEPGSTCSEHGLDSSDKTHLLDLNEVEAWQQPNPYILHAYRPVSGSYLRSMASIVTLHNQTVNILSHLLGFLLFLGVCYHVLISLVTQYPTTTGEDIFVFGCFFAGALVCLGCSVGFHTLNNHSHAVYETWLCCDLMGILALTAGSWVPGVYYGYYCQANMARLFSLAITILAAGCAILCGVPHYRTPQWASFRTVMFVTLGLSGFVPMTHAALTFGLDQAHAQMGWWWFILEAVSYCTGAAVYASKYPEKRRPGVFDILGSSHQIFHVCVVGGALAHLVGIVQAFHYNHTPDTRMCRL